MQHILHALNVLFGEKKPAVRHFFNGGDVGVDADPLGIGGGGSLPSFGGLGNYAGGGLLGAGPGGPIIDPHGATGQAGMQDKIGASGKAPEITNNFGGVQGLKDPLANNPAVTADFTNSNNIGVQQQALAQQLQAQANGQMSPAQAMLQNQLKANTNANNLQSASLLGSQKGINPALAARMTAQNNASNNQQAGGQAANLALGLQGQAQNQLGGMLQGWRGQDLQTELGGADIGLANRGQNIQGANGYNNTQTQAQLGGADIQSKYDVQNSKAKSGMFGGLLNAAGALGAAAIAASTGTKVPGNAPHPGDDPRNDTVDAKLSPGEIVIPRSKANDPEAAKEFVAHIQGQKAGGDSKAKGYAGVLNAKREVSELKKRIAILEKHVGRAG